MARLLIDLDDTIVNLRGAWIEHYNNLHNTSYTVSDMDCWHLEDKFGKGVLDILYKESFFYNLKPFPNAIDVLKRLSKKHEIIIVTASFIGFPMKEKGEWIRDNLSFLSKGSYCITSRKDLISGDLLFDDAPHNIETFKGITVALRAAHNKEASPDYFVNNLLEFEDLVNKLF